MLSLLPPHVSSYASSTSHHPTVQSSYDYASTVCNPPTWGPVAPYTPPMSSSPSATAHFAAHADRAFDHYTRMRQQPQQPHELHYWPQPAAAAYPQQIYPPPPPQHQHQHQHHLTTLPLHPRSPRSQAAAYLPPLPVSEPYPNYTQSQAAREFLPNGLHYHMGGLPGQSNLASVAAAVKQPSAKPVRRTKQHVQTACFNCKKAHLSCDVGRPCNRCKQSGKQDTCYNVAHKRRGRPRLRDTFGNKIPRPNDQQQPGSAVPITNGAAVPERRRSDPLRVLKSNDGQPAQYVGNPSSANGLVGNANGQAFGFPSGNFDGKYSNLPIAFLDLDLNIVQMNQLFGTVFGFDFGGHRRKLEQLIDDSDRHRLRGIQNSLRQEKDACEPVYLPPLRPGSSDADSIPMVESADVSAYLQRFKDRTEVLRLRVAGGVQQIPVSIRLAKAEVFFAVLILSQIPETGPTFAQQQPPRLMQPPSPAYAYSNGFQMPPNAYAAPQQMGAPPRGSVSSSAPPSPFYTYESVPQSLAGSTPTATGYYMPPQNHPSMYAGYTTQSGVQSQAMGSGAEPRQFSGYQQAPSPLQVQFPAQGQQHLLQPDYQLPPIGSQGDRPRSAETQMVMRPEHYGRDPQQGYMHEGPQHMDPTQAGQAGPGKGRRPDLQNLMD